jgi:hypothetical protein
MSKSAPGVPRVVIRGRATPSRALLVARALFGPHINHPVFSIWLPINVCNIKAIIRDDFHQVLVSTVARVKVFEPCESNALKKLLGTVL